MEQPRSTGTTLFSIDATIIEKSGLRFFGDQLHLYRRDEFEKQFNFLEEAVLKSGAIGCFSWHWKVVNGIGFYFDNEKKRLVDYMVASAP